MKKILPFLFLTVAALCARAELRLEALGEGLGYLRIRTLADGATLSAALAKEGACVVDLRYPGDGLADLAPLLRAIAGHAPGQPLFLLVSPTAPLGLERQLGAIPPGAVVLGATGAPLPEKSGVEVAQTPEADRLAYEAYEAGQPLADLVSGKIEKERYDEASLMTDFRGGNTDAQPPLSPDPSKPKATPETARKPVPCDRVLQRAVHLHRALLALARHG